MRVDGKIEGIKRRGRVASSPSSPREGNKGEKDSERLWEKGGRDKSSIDLLSGQGKNPFGVERECPKIGISRVLSETLRREERKCVGTDGGGQEMRRKGAYHIQLRVGGSSSEGDQDRRIVTKSGEEEYGTCKRCHKGSLGGVILQCALKLEIVKEDATGKRTATF